MKTSGRNVYCECAVDGTASTAAFSDGPGSCALKAWLKFIRLALYGVFG